MAFCLPKEFANKFIDALKSGKIKPEELINMSSSERRDFLAKIVGAVDAKEVNALLESKLLLKDQKRGMVSWAKKVAGISERTRADLIARIEKMDKVLDPKDQRSFLEDLAAKKLGVEVSMEEAQKIYELSKKQAELKQVWEKNKRWTNIEDRLRYGFALLDLRDYVDGLKQKANKLSLKDIKNNPGEAIKRTVRITLGTTKSLLASLDNSFFGRQGIKMLATNPKIWANAFIKSWGDIGKELKGIDAMRLIRADVLSRENAMNGKYQKMGIDIGINHEEAFPSTLQENIPLLGRFFKASDAAFSGAAMRLRADYADKLIPRMEEMGLNMLKKEDAEGVGSLINSMTGRGRVGVLGNEEVNSILFSIRFLKSNFDTLTAHMFDSKASKIVKLEAAKNLAKIVGVIGATLYTVNILQPGSVTFDPRSKLFGKVKIRGTTFDLTGGMGSMATLATQLVLALAAVGGVYATHNGKKGIWTQNNAGKWTELNSGKFGSATVLDAFNSYLEGKTAPVASVLRDAWSGLDYSGNKPTLKSSLLNLITPISIQTFNDLKNNPKSAPMLATMILDGLGIGSYTPPAK